MKKQLQGTIISDKMQNTVVVKVDSFVVHPKYRKRYKISKKYKADTNNVVSKIGDVVVIEETRPISKDKKWKLVSIVKSFKEQEAE